MSSPAEAARGQPVELVVGPRIRDLEGLRINRVWPTARRRLVGPFIFCDHLERAALEPGRGLDVPPHPHIGLATVTYLFEGELVHRDSLGVEQLIRPGEVNWMTAGRGITHSERSSDRARAEATTIHGMQIWVALPPAHAEAAPAFEHYAKESLPRIVEPDRALTLIAGSAFGETSPVATQSALFYIEADLERGGSLDLPARMGERAVYVVGGAVGAGGRRYESGRLVVFRDGLDVRLEALDAAKLMLFGGARLEGEWHIWWNFVASSAERIEQARRDWAEDRFPSVPGDTGRMPAPA